MSVLGLNRSSFWTNRIVERVVQTDFNSHSNSALNRQSHADGVKPLIDYAEINSILRIRLTDADAAYFLGIAIEHVENYLGKTLLRARRENTSDNTHLILPYGPVFSASDIEKVEYDKKTIDKKDYTVSNTGYSLQIALNNRFFSHKKDRKLKVTYLAGYIQNKDVPRVFINAVMVVIDYLYRNNGDEKAKKGLDVVLADMLGGDIC